jgi:6-pyruvoyltetrahydropterin/6-carboxytetrahydropterin synthase
MLVSISRTEYFEAAHLLPGHEKGCKNCHGHSYKATVEVTGPQNGQWGMVMDYNDLKAALKEVLPDHKYLHYKGNPISEDIVKVLDKYNLSYMTFDCPTSVENIAPILMNLIEEYIQNELGYKQIQVTKICIDETKNSHCIITKPYKEDN